METKIEKEKLNRIEEWIVNNIDSYDHDAEIICLVSGRTSEIANRLVTLEIRILKEYQDGKTDHKKLFFRYVRGHERNIYIGKKHEAYKWANRFGIRINKDCAHPCGFVMDVIYDTYLKMYKDQKLDQLFN